MNACPKSTLAVTPLSILLLPETASTLFMPPISDDAAWL